MAFGDDAFLAAGTCLAAFLTEAFFAFFDVDRFTFLVDLLARLAALLAEDFFGLDRVAFLANTLALLAATIFAFLRFLAIDFTPEHLLNLW